VLMCVRERSDADVVALWAERCIATAEAKRQRNKHKDPTIPDGLNFTSTAMPPGHMCFCEAWVSVYIE